MSAPRGNCLVCSEEQEDLIGHLLTMHPSETDGGFMTWPDGSAVIVDSTLEPVNFDEATS